MKNLNRKNSALRRVLQFVILTLLIFITDCIHSQPLKKGQSVVTSFDDANPNYNCVKVIDLRNRPPFVIGGNSWNPNFYAGANWTHQRMGDVFGVAMDDANPPNIFIASSSVFCNTPRSTAGIIFKINGSTWNVTDFVMKAVTPGPPVIGSNTIPNTGPPGLGNICFDKWNKQLFATNLEDGKIYRIKDIAGSGIIQSVFDPFTADVPANGFVSRGERLWGIGVYGRSSVDVRVYFGRWVSDKSFPNNGANEIWSVALDNNGNFIIPSLQLEITLPVNTTNVHSNPASDIEFSYKGNMLIGERTMAGDMGVCYNGGGVWSHESRILEYQRNLSNMYNNSTYTWHKVGGGGNSFHQNSTGGVDYHFSIADSIHNTFSGCDSVFVGTGDGLFLQSGFGYIYGVQFTDKGYIPGGPFTFNNFSHFIDVNGVGGLQDKTSVGDIDVYRGSTELCACNNTDFLYMQDTPADVGNEPNLQSGSVMWTSDDIWICNNNTQCANHTNPIASINNKVRVRVRNLSEEEGSCGGILTLQWAKASTGLSWQTPWNGTTFFGTQPWGGVIGAQPIPPIPGGGSVIIDFQWVPPNPNSYPPVPPGESQGHFCLLARIETSPNTPYGMTFPETSNLYGNVKDNRKIVWKNVDVVYPLSRPNRATSFLVENPKPLASVKKFQFENTDGQLFSNAQVIMKLDANLYQKWEQGGKESFGILEQADSSFSVLLSEAFISNIMMEADSKHNMSVKVITKSLLKETDFHVVQYDVYDGRIEGGNTYRINPNNPPVLNLNLSLHIEGLLQQTGLATRKVKPVIYLHSPKAPYAIVDSAEIEIDSVSHSGTGSFYTAPDGDYYLAVKYMNTIETWSAHPVTFSSGSAAYSFTNSVSQAYGNNMIMKYGRSCIFSGDVNQDGTVDATDVSTIDNDASNFVSGNVVTDLTGDEFVDGTDFAIADNNAANFVSVVQP